MRYEQIDLEEFRNKYPSYKPKPPFKHQTEAFQALTAAFKFPINQYKGGLLVLPTGAGKTYTAVNWICNNIVSKKIKVLWFAQSSYLLNQAAKSFYDNALEASPARRTLNIRVVSSSPANSPASSIDVTDDILIITTQTAIKNFSAKPEDEYGNIIETKFIRFLRACAESGLFVVLDEAHHAPAYGFRHLWQNIRDIIPNLYMLGLTATPTYNDIKTSGWLFKIFDLEILARAEQSELIAQNILALPKYIQKPTGRDFTVDDKLYDRLVRDHKDLPAEIVQRLADDSARNDYIVNEFAAKKNDYGKTIIFADRVDQCIYLRTKLRAKGINAEAVYSDNEVKPNSPEGRNKRTSTENEKIISDFKNGKYDVLANVRILTEGVDIPDVKTVFLTRQTTSSILMTQMIGRALRGKNAGGGENKAEANIVLFIDNWKGLIDVWAHPGGLNDEVPMIRGYRPIEYISVSLIEQLSKQIESGVNYFPETFLSYIPAGWYQTDISVNVKDDFNSTREEPKEEMVSFIEFAMVYDKNKEKYDRFIRENISKIPERWSDESLDERSIMPQIENWIDEYFDPDEDNIGNLLMSNLIRISRHIAKNNEAPRFHSFDDREKYDLNRLAEVLIRKNPLEQHNCLMMEFEKPGSWWKLIFKDYYKFKTAFDAAINSVIFSDRNIESSEEIVIDDVELTEEEKEQVKRRDNYTCLCCGKNGKGTRLQIDHIVPVFLGGRADVENSQTLCKECNQINGVNIINFRINKTCLSKPKELILHPVQGNEYLECTLLRTINFFYRCQAVSSLNTSKRRNGKYYYAWRVELYQGNNPAWLIEHKKELRSYLCNDFGLDHIKDIEIIGIKAGIE